VIFWVLDVQNAVVGGRSIEGQMEAGDAESASTLGLNSNHGKRFLEGNWLMVDGWIE
jgi:hypothetical protein